MMSRWKGIHGDYMDLMEVGTTRVLLMCSVACIGSRVDHGLMACC
jgi:hypothetical protein